MWLGAPRERKDRRTPREAGTLGTLTSARGATPSGRRCSAAPADSVHPGCPPRACRPAGLAKEFWPGARSSSCGRWTRVALRLRSEQSSFALYRDVVVDLNEFPVLTWSWKVVCAAGGGGRARAGAGRPGRAALRHVSALAIAAHDERRDRLRLGQPRAGRHAAPEHPGRERRIIVVDSGDGQRGHVAPRTARTSPEDYAALFGRRPPRVGRVAVMIDTNDTRGAAEAFVADIVFAKAAR